MLNWRRPILLLLMTGTGSRVPRTLRYIRSLEQRSPRALRQLQDERLASLLCHAWAQTDYYRQVLGECGAVVDGQVDLDRFEDIPLLTKDVIRREGTRLRAKRLPDGRRPYVNRTGGSTGEPLEFWQDDQYEATNIADKLHQFELLGKRMGEPEMKIWGSTRDLVKDTGGRTAGLRNFLYNRTIESCAELSPSRIREICGRINRVRPKAIWGYIDGLYTIAEFVNRHRISLRSPAAVFCGGGTFFPHMERAIQEAFGCLAINFYGSREMGAIAGERADKDGLYVTSHSHYVETLDESGRPMNGNEGDLVITALDNYAMPFIRYRIGDRGVLDGGADARRPRLTSVSGRAMESLVRPTGELVSPIYLITMIGATTPPGILSKIQVIQKDFCDVRLKVVIDPTAEPSRADGELRALSDRVQELMGPPCVVTYECVAAIPPQPSGKYLYTICEIDERARAEHAARGLAAFAAPIDLAGT